MNFLKKLLFKKKLFRTLTVIFLSFTVFFSVATEVAYKYESTLNAQFNTTSFKKVNPDGVKDDECIYYESDYKNSEEVTKYGKSVSYEAEAEGMVMLKNKNSVLPLANGASVSTVLQNAVSFSYGSSGSGKIDSSKYTDLKTALEGVGLKVNETLWNFYSANQAEQGVTYDRKNNPIYQVKTLPWSSYTDEVKNSVSTMGGTAVVVVGRVGGEGEDVSTKNSDGYDGSYLALTKEEIEILAKLTEFKKAGKLDGIVVLLNTAFAMETSFLKDDRTFNIDGTNFTIDVDSCLWIGNVGIGGIFAVADALVGKVNPSGRLTDTYVNDNFAAPATASWANQNASGTFAKTYTGGESLDGSQQKYGVYVEGIYVGYRYFETRYEDIVLKRANVGEYDYNAAVSRPFGYGLSYTTFEYSDYSVTKTESGDYEAAITVKNTGEVAGKEVVQIYLQKPYTAYDVQNKVEKASVELVGFAKTKELAPGKPETLKIKIEKESFKTYDANGYKTYILEEGEYYLAVGTSAHSAVNNILAKKGKTTADGMTEDGNANFAVKVGEDITLDTVTYSTSKETNEKITNKLDFADINKYDGRGENSVTYLSRNDWNGTFPKDVISLTVTEQMKADLVNGKPIKEDENAKTPVYGVNSGLSLIMLRGKAYDDEEWEALLNQMTWKEQTLLASSACYGTKGLESVVLPEIKAQDGPTAVVSSKESVSMPSEGIWASTYNLELIKKIGDALAEDARNAGVTGMYLPGVNIHRSAFGGRAHEYFSEDPYMSAVAAENEIIGLQKKGVIPYVKHYVFNDEEDNRIGVGIWLNEQSAREIYLKPFEYATAPSRGNSHGLMSSFNRAGCIWTSASSALMEDILRGEFGFDGVVLTDMAMGQTSYMTYDSFMYGTDLFLDPGGSHNAFDAFSSSATFRNAIRKSLRRYLYVVVNYSAAMNGYDVATKNVRVLNWWQLTLLLCIVVTSVIAAVCFVLTVLAYIKEFVFDKKVRQQVFR